MEPVTKNDLFNACVTLIVGFVLLCMLVAVHNQSCHNKEMVVLKEINKNVTQGYALTKK